MLFGKNIKGLWCMFILLACINYYDATQARAEEVATPSMGGPTTEEVARQEVHESDEAILQQVKALLAYGRRDDARTLLSRLLSRPKPHLEAHFLSGMLFLEQGQLKLAAADFRKMLVRDPSLVRPRLELARVLYLDKDYEGARYNFEQVMAGELPDAVRTNINRFLSMIRTQVPTFNFGMEIISDSNPKKSTSNRTVNIGGRFYSLNTTAPNHLIWGIALTGSARIPLPHNPTWYIAANAELTKFPNKENHDQLYLQSVIGKHLLFGRNTLSLEAGYQVFQYQWHHLYSGAVVRISDYFQQTDKLSWQVSIEGKQQKYPNYQYLDGWMYTAGVESQFVHSTRSRWKAGLSISHNDASEKAYTYVGPGAYLNFSNEWDSGLISGITVRWAMTNYYGMDPFFGVTRKDQEWGAELNLVNRKWQISNLYPRLVVGMEKHDSNIDLYTFKRNYVNFAISREF